MGEYADMMLDGSCCQVCGEGMDETPGYPVTCEGCGGNEWENHSGGNDYKIIKPEKGEKQIDFILRARGYGFVNRQIAAMLGISLGSLKKRLKTHARSLTEKEQ